MCFAGLGLPVGLPRRPGRAEICLDVKAGGCATVRHHAIPILGRRSGLAGEKSYGREGSILLCQARHLGTDR